MIDGTDPPSASILGNVLRVALWGAVALAGVVAAMRGAPLVALCAVSTLGLAALPRGFTALSGLRFPPGLSTGALAFTAAALLLGEMAGFYVRLPWWDLALHVVVSIVLAQAGWALSLLLTAGGAPRTGPWIASTLAFGFAMMVGALWELLEFCIDWTFGTNAQRSGLVDSMTDLMADVVGAVWGAAAVQLRLAGRVRLPGGGLTTAWMDLNPIIYGAWPAWSARIEERRRGALARQHGALERGGQASRDVVAGQDDVADR